LRLVYPVTIEHREIPWDMRLIKLSDAELDAVLQAARPIAPHHRDAFLQAIAAALVAQRELGPGMVYRAIRDAPRLP
jgi:hypothetical protein